jgi:hypothetical protein
MHAAVRSSVAAGAVVATAGALVAAPIAPAHEIETIPVQSHDIELAALTAPSAAFENLAETGDIGQALNAGATQFNSYFNTGISEFASTVEVARENL